MKDHFEDERKKLARETEELRDQWNTLTPERRKTQTSITLAFAAKKERYDEITGGAKLRGLD